MTTQTKARRFSPIFTAVVVPGSVENLDGKNGKYIRSQKSTVKIEGKDDRTMTVMAFGKCRDAVAGKLRKGRKIALAVQFDGPTMNIIGLPREKAPAAAEG